MRRISGPCFRLRHDFFWSSLDGAKERCAAMSTSEGNLNEVNGKSRGAAASLESYDNKPHLVLFSDTFPFGKGEKSFLIPELEALSRSFRITLVTQVSEELRAEHADVTPLDPSIELVIIEPSSTLEYLFALPSILTSSLMHKEVRDLVSDGFSFARLLDSVKQYLSAKAFWRACKRRGLFECSNTALYYSFWFTYRLLSLCMEAQHTPGMRIIGRVNGFDLYNERCLYRRQPFQRIKRDGCNRVLFGASTAKEYFTQAFGAEAFYGQYVLNRLGVDGGSNKNSSVIRDPFLLVSCSNVIPLKHVDLIVEALRKLSNPDIRWVHFGDGPELGYIRGLAEGNGLNCWLPGSVSNDFVLSFYRDSSVGCFIALSESEGGCPVSLQEALSFGIPAIVSEAGGAHYEGVDSNGIRLPDNPSVDEVASAIDSMYHLGDEDWQSMSARSYELWEQCFDSDACKAELIHVLNSIL